MAKVRQPRVEVTVTTRDYVMARAAAARSCVVDALAAIDELIEFNTRPDEDTSGKKRKADIHTALEALGDASRALECAEEVWRDVDVAEREPWDEDEEEDDEEEDDDEEEEDDDEEADD